VLGVTQILVICFMADQDTVHDSKF
jgi:hypothetical protein